MNKEIINEWLSDIATPTGISYSGDRTISESMAEKIVDYVSNLEQALDEIEKIILKATTDEETGEDLGYSDKIPYYDLLEIIQKAKGE